MDVRMVGWESKDSRPEYWEAIRASMDTIVSEDARVLSRIQRNIESGLLENIQFGYLERTLYWFAAELDGRMGIENMYTELRIEKTLYGKCEDYMSCVRMEIGRVECRERVGQDVRMWGW